MKLRYIIGCTYNDLHIDDVKHEFDDIFGEELWFYIKDEIDGLIHK